MDDLESLHHDVQRLRSILVDVGAGQRRIQDAEQEYVSLRADVARKFKAHKISDPNGFHSLWDWYGYWKENGLATYQSRRDYVSKLFRPVTEAIDTLRTGPPPQDVRSFSERHGFSPPVPEPVKMIYEEAPDALRQVIVDVALKTGWDSDDLLSAASRIGKRPWELPVPMASQTASRIQLKKLMLSWPWYHVYDFIEVIANPAQWEGAEDPGAIEYFEETLNEYFRHAGIAWTLTKGKLITKGSEALEVALTAMAASLGETSLQTAHREIHEALADLSRRPAPDLTGAIQHAMAALECVARTVAGDPNPTLGTLLKHHPGLVPAPLDSSIEKIWGYASNMGRHLKEGHAPTRQEAELIVGIATVVATYLSRKASSE